MIARNAFPLDGWLLAGSDSYATDELFRGTRRTLVYVFAAADESHARTAHDALVDRGVTTATLDLVTHADGTSHFYLWGERDEMARLVPEVKPEGRFGRR
jgi:hypothetical protein